VKKYIFFVIDSINNPATGNEMKKIDSFNDMLQENGHWVMAAGIGEPNSATQIDSRDSETIVLNGSLFETPEFYSGFWVLQVENHNQALDLATKASKACNRKLEIRPFL
jgi:hypothetical protein